MKHETLNTPPWYTGMTPEMLSKMVSNPELMVLMQNAKLQEIMKKVRRAYGNYESFSVEACS